MAGKFIISLDFELRWGGAEKWELTKYKNYFLTTRGTIPIVLDLFEKRKIKSTWATVGFLFAKSKKQLIEFSPLLKPTYDNKNLNYYEYFKNIGDNEKEDPLHFAGSLIEQIIQTEGQELGTHTFSHYYCNEKGQNIKQFEADLIAVQNIAKENYHIELKSLVFPRNQYNVSYLNVARANGIEVVRSNPNVWFWKNTHGKVSPLFRAMDTLIPISDSVCFGEKDIKRTRIIELPASRFLRPYSSKEKAIQTLKINRIKNEMQYAAKNNLNYHLWWHPHNFGNFPMENVQQLKDILDHYQYLNEKYGFESVCMCDYR